MSENTQSGDNAAATLLADVADLVSDDRDSHGDAVENQEHIADGWTWYLRGQGIIDDDQAVDGGDVARMMILLKMSRACVGEYDIDHDRDKAGYAGIAAAYEALEGDATADELEVTGDE